MQNRTPVARSERPALPDFTPVPRQGNRRDGWTPAWLRSFIKAGKRRKAKPDAGRRRRRKGMG